MFRSTTTRHRWLALGLTASIVAVAACASPSAKNYFGFWYYMQVARRALRHDAQDNAISALHAAEKANPDSAEVHFLLGVANRRSGHLDDCRGPLEKAAELGWSKKDVKFQLTMLAFQAGDRDAEQELQRIAVGPMSDDDAEQLYECFAKGYLAEYRISEAELCLNHWIEWRPHDVRPRLLRAEIPMLTGHRAKQLAEYEEILKIDPNSYPGHLGLGNILLHQHAVDEALVHFRWCNERLPSDVMPQLGISACLRHQGKLQESAEIVHGLMRPDLPRDQQAFLLVELAQVAQQQGDYEKTASLLAQSVELHPQPEAHYSLGTTFAKLGRREEAQRHLDRSKELEAMSEQLYDLEQRMSAHPESAEIRFEIGRRLKALGYPKACAAMMLAALRWDPDHAEAHALLAEYYDSIDRGDLAREHRALIAKTGHGAGSELHGDHIPGGALPEGDLPGQSLPGKGSDSPERNGG